MQFWFKLPEQKERNLKTSIWIAVCVVVGLVLGLGAGNALGYVGGYLVTKSAEHEARRGWVLIPVTVAKRDLAAGETVRIEDLEQRAVPEQTVTSSVVKPDTTSYILGLPIQVPVAAGDPLRWSDFPLEVVGASGRDVYEACAAKMPERTPSMSTVSQLRAAIAEETVR